MATTPNTRASLIARLSDADDVEAWQEFVQIYVPLLYRLARRKGLQHADAEETAQEVLISVSRAVHRWELDVSRFDSQSTPACKQLPTDNRATPDSRADGQIKGRISPLCRPKLILG